MGVEPTPEQASSALAEAENRTVEVGRADAGMRRLLLSIAAIYLAIGIPAAFVTRGGSPLPVVLVVAVVVIGCAAMILLARRVRAYSRHGYRRWGLRAGLFLLWNLTAIVFSVLGGWFGPQSPAWHFTAFLALLSLAPLLGAVPPLERGR